MPETTMPCRGCGVPKDPAVYCVTIGCDGHYDSEPSRRFREVMPDSSYARVNATWDADSDQPATEVTLPPVNWSAVTVDGFTVEDGADR